MTDIESDSPKCGASRNLLVRYLCICDEMMTQSRAAATASCRMPTGNVLTSVSPKPPRAQLQVNAAMAVETQPNCCMVRQGSTPGHLLTQTVQHHPLHCLRNTQHLQQRASSGHQLSPESRVTPNTVTQLLVSTVQGAVKEQHLPSCSARGSRSRSTTAMVV